MKMNSTFTAGSLARLSELASLLDCSLARYVRNVRPWHWRPYLTFADALRRQADEHGWYAEAIVKLLHERRYSLGAFTFPMEFAYYNDLSLEYLAPRMLEHQSRLAVMAKDIFYELAEVGDHVAHALVEGLLISLRRCDALMEVLLAPDRLCTLRATPPDVASLQPRTAA